MKYIILAASLLIGGVVQASISERGTAQCVIKNWDSKHYQLACDPRTPKIALRTPAEWVKSALKNKEPKIGETVDVVVTQEKLDAWIDMNKKVLAKVDGAKTAPKKGAK